VVSQRRRASQELPGLLGYQTKREHENVAGRARSATAESASRSGLVSDLTHARSHSGGDPRAVTVRLGYPGW